MRPNERKIWQYLSAIHAKKPAAEDREREVYLCRRTVRVKVEGQVIPTNLLKIERETLNKLGERRKGTARRIERWSDSKY